MFAAVRTASGIEVRVGNVETHVETDVRVQTAGRQVFGAVAKTDTDIKVLINQSLYVVGRTGDTVLTAFTDGCSGLRRILADAAVSDLPILDWSISACAFSISSKQPAPCRPPIPRRRQRRRRSSRRSNGCTGGCGMAKPGADCSGTGARRKALLRSLVDRKAHTWRGNAGSSVRSRKPKPRLPGPSNPGEGDRSPELREQGAPNNRAEDLARCRCPGEQAGRSRFMDASVATLIR
jgi:hypothetical protein